jgi:hypothetical protein
VAAIRIDAALTAAVRIAFASTGPAGIVAVRIAVSASGGGANTIAVIRIAAVGLTVQGSATVVLGRSIMAMAIEG